MVLSVRVHVRAVLRSTCTCGKNNYLDLRMTIAEMSSTIPGLVAPGWHIMPMLRRWRMSCCLFAAPTHTSKIACISRSSRPNMKSSCAGVGTQYRSATASSSLEFMVLEFRKFERRGKHQVSSHSLSFVSQDCTDHALTHRLLHQLRIQQASFRTFPDSLRMLPGSL